MQFTSNLDTAVKNTFFHMTIREIEILGEYKCKEKYICVYKYIYLNICGIPAAAQTGLL